MKKLFLLFILTITASQLTYGQFENANYFLMKQAITMGNSGIYYEDTSSYTGTPYNNPSFLTGTIYKKGELLADNVAIRYNAVADEMEVKKTLTQMMMRLKY